MSRDAWIGLLLILLTFSAVGNVVQFLFSVVKEQPESENYGAANLHGWVTDSLTKKPIPNVNVFFSFSKSEHYPYLLQQYHYTADTDYKGFYAIQLTYSEMDVLLLAYTFKQNFTQVTPLGVYEKKLKYVLSFEAEWNFTMWESAEFAV